MRTFRMAVKQFKLTSLAYTLWIGLSPDHFTSQIDAPNVIDETYAASVIITIFDRTLIL